MNNLAVLLQTQGDDRLSEARQLAEEALEMKRTIDPAAEIWKTYQLLAEITIKQGDQSTARDYRRQSRQSYAAFAGSRHELQEWEDFIQGVVAAISDYAVRQQLIEAFASLIQRGNGDFVEAIRRILEGERDEDELCLDLNYDEALIAGEVLRKLRS